MGTRCNVKVTGGKNTVWIYRHWDGYPEGAGRDLYTILRSVGRHGGGNRVHPNNLCAGDVAAAIVGWTEPPKDWHREGEVYMPFEFTEAEHRDIEYLYSVRVKRDGGFYDGRTITVTVHAVEYHYSDDYEKCTKKKRRLFSGTVQEFGVYVHGADWIEEGVGAEAGVAP